MVQKAQGRRIYKTAQGKQVDLDLLISRNELTPAVGNAKVNARGDELGPGGKIVRKREDVMQERYKQSPTMARENVVRQDAGTSENVQPVQENTASESELAEWEEDDDGNFIRKAK